jgi:hypothetical protein
MQKRLVRVGESLALIIDKPILSVMNMNRMTRLDVTYDGNRIIIEPLIGNGDPRLPTAREALKVYRELERLGLTQAYFDLLTPVPMRLGRYVTTIDHLREAPTHELAITMRRMAELRWRLRFGWPKREAIAAAVAAVPFEKPCGTETRLDGPDLLYAT